MQYGGDVDDIEARRKLRHEAEGERLRAALKQARLNAGMTQQEVSELAGPHKSVVSRIEKGVIKEPSFLTVAELADIYGIGLNQLARMAGISFTREIQAEAGWEAVDQRVVSGVFTLLRTKDEAWKEAVIQNFYLLTETKEQADRELANMLAERGAILDRLTEALNQAHTVTSETADE